MSNIYERFSIVCADLARLDITNEDPMRYSKRCCVLAAQSALDEGIRRAEEMLRLVHNIKSDIESVRHEYEKEV